MVTPTAFSQEHQIRGIPGVSHIDLESHAQMTQSITQSGEALDEVDLRRRVASRLLGDGLPVDEVVSRTGLTLETVEELRAALK